MRLLQRYVLFELMTVAVLALLGLTVLIVCAGVLAEATRQGLGPAQVILILPYLIPGTLPYTIPATLLFATSSVYGRLAGAGEITAIRAAGIHLTAIVWPTLALGAVLSVGTLYLADRFVPWARAGIRQTVLTTLEDTLYDYLRRHRVINDSRRNFTVAVQGVEGRVLIRPTFRYQPPNGGEVVAQSREAILQIDTENGQILIQMENASVTTGKGSVGYLERFNHPIAIPGGDLVGPIKPRDLSIAQIQARIDELGTAIGTIDSQEEEQAIRSALAVLRGAPAAMLPPEREVQQRQNERHRIDRDIDKLQTELHSRWALSFSGLVFVLLGAPVAIWGQRRDFLGNFMICFLPILVAYYPIVLACMNLSKDGRVSPAWAMWIGNVILAAAGGWALRRVFQH